MNDHPTESARSIQLRIDSRLEDIAMVGVASRAWAMLAGLDETQAFNVELCVVEAVTNSVEHGYQCEQGHPVDVVVRLTSTLLEFEVRDQGKGLGAEHAKAEPTTAEAALAVPDAMSPRGRGGFLIDELMDHVDYRVDDRGVTLTIGKTLAA